MGKLVLERGWTLCLALLVLACQSQPIAPKILFVDSSEGLPQKGQWRHRVAVADLDDDGNMEIIAPPARKELNPRPHIWSRTPEGRWQEWQEEFPPWSYSYGDVAVEDFDRDGHKDLALAGHAAGVAVLLSRGRGKWELMKEGLPPPGSFSTRTLAAGDLDGDGWPDLVAVAEVIQPEGLRRAGIRVFHNGAGKEWREEKIEEAKRIFSDCVTVGDVNGDGRLEVIVAPLTQGRKEIVWFQEGGRWRSSTDGLPDGVFVQGVGVCDLDRDGHQEILLATDGPRHVKDTGPRVFSLQGESWTDLSSGLPQMHPLAIAGGDLAGDHRCTLAVIDYQGFSLRLFRQQDSGMWEEWTRLEPPPDSQGKPFGLALADVDGDSRLDVVVNYAADPDTGGIRVWLNRTDASGRSLQ
jgi:hypothetical protein